MCTNERIGLLLVIALIGLVTLTIGLTTSNILLVIFSIVTTLATLSFPILTYFAIPGHQLIRPLIRCFGNPTLQGVCTTAIVVLLGVNFAFGSCAYKRYRYVSYLNAFDSRQHKFTHLANAFTLFPNRTESIVLLKIFSNQYRAPVTWDYTRQFTDGLKTAMTSYAGCGGGGVSPCILYGREMDDLGIVSYASLLPEAGDIDSAIDLLSALKSPTAALLRQLLEIDRSGYILQKFSWRADRSKEDFLNLVHGSTKDWEVYNESVAELQEQVIKDKFDADLAEIRSTHYYQEALDRIGSHYLIRCALESVNMTELNYNNHVIDKYRLDSIKWYKKVIIARDRTTKLENYWIRNPGKLVAYHAYLFVSDTDEPYFRLVPFFRNCIGFEEEYKELVQTTEMTREYWKRNTIYGLDGEGELEDYLREQLTKGWRYHDVYNTYFNNYDAP